MVSFASQFKGTNGLLTLTPHTNQPWTSEKTRTLDSGRKGLEQANAKVVEYINSKALADRLLHEEENKIKNMLPPGITLEELPVYNDSTNDAREAAAKFETNFEEWFLHKNNY